MKPKDLWPFSDTPKEPAMPDDPLATVKDDVAKLPESYPSSMTIGKGMSKTDFYFQPSGYGTQYAAFGPPPTPLQQGVKYVTSGITAPGLDGPQERHVEIVTTDGYRITAWITITKEPTE